MKREWLKELFIVLPMVLLIAAGCGKSGNRTVATVGDYKISTEEFNEHFSRIRMAYTTAEEEYNKRREVLDSMIVTRLLIQGAYELGIDRLDDVARAVAVNKNRFLITRLYEKHISSKAQPTEAELQDYYNRLEHRVRVSHIVVSDPDTAQVVFERIKNGENFEQMAFEYSIDPDARRNKGDLGFLTWGATVDEFQQAAYAMQPGEISPPIRTRYGYHIIKLVDRLPNENRRDFETEKPLIQSQLTQRKSVQLMEDYFAAAKTKYPITIDTATCDYLLHKREQVYPPQLLATLPRNDFDVDALDRNEKELPLATWAGGTITVMEYFMMVRGLPLTLRPNFDDYDSLATTIFELKKTDVLTLEALTEGLDNDEQLLKSLQMFKEFNMADIMRNDSIAAPPPPEEEELRRYYEENLDEFTTPAKIHIHEILLSDEIRARQLAKEIRSLDDFQAKAMQLTERPGKRSNKGNMGYIEQKWFPEIFEAAEKVNVGRIGGPVMTRGKYSIFYVDEKVPPEIKAFLDVKRAITDNLKRQRKNDAVEAWVDERLKTVNVEVDEDAIWASIEVDRYQSVDTTGT